MKKKEILCNIIKVVAFFGIAFLIFLFANVFFRPVWLSEDSIGDGEGSPLEIEQVGDVAAYEATNEDATEGFYAEPENHLNTLFVGASMTSVGVTPMELYEKYGVCAYSITSEAQPVLASYFWVKEAERLHPDSLKTVIFDVSMMRRDVGKGFYEKALNGMHFSDVKLEAIKEASNGPGAMLGYTFPLLTYHSRWAELGRTDFTKFGYEPRSYLRGYNMRTIRLFDEGTYEEMPLSTSVLNEGVQARVDVHEKAEKYLRKMVQFCKENDIKLVLYKTPAVGNWGNKEHFSIQTLADELDVEFLDFTFEPLVDEIGYNPATDSENRKHNNYYGATKLTDWFGKYLTQECGAEDVRGNSEYSYMDDQLAQYRDKVEKVIKLKAATTPGEYLSYLAEGGDFTTMITVRETAARNLSEEDREILKKCGLEKLAALQDSSSYIGVIENGSIKIEISDSEDPSDDAEVRSYKNKNDTLGYTAKLPGGKQYVLTSGSKEQGDISSCLIGSDEMEYSRNMRGINIVVYDNSAETIVDDTYFDTWIKPDRESYDTEAALKEALESGAEYSDLSESLQKLYLYNKRVEYYRDAEHLRIELSEDPATALAGYIAHYMDDENLMICISVNGDAVSKPDPVTGENVISLEEDTRKAVASLGLKNLADIDSNESYTGVIDGSQVLFDISGNGAKDSDVREDGALEITGTEFDIVSKGASDETGFSHIILNQKNYSPEERGINIVIFDKKYKVVADTATF